MHYIVETIYYLSVSRTDVVLLAPFLSIYSYKYATFQFLDWSCYSVAEIGRHDTHSQLFVII